MAASQDTGTSVRGTPPRGTPLRDALDGAVTAIAAAGCETPRLDAELLLAHVLGVGRAQLLLDPEAPVEGPAAGSAFMVAGCAGWRIGARSRTLERAA